MSSIHFIADTHLSAETPALNMLLMQNMAEWMGKIEALYILGNFFEVWLGDDIRHHVAEELVATLQAFATRTPVYMQHGSRDFLLGADFAQRAGVTFLPEVTRLQAYGQNIVLLHGDALYPHSQEQENFRTLSRTPAWQERVAHTPVPERKQTLAQHIIQHAHQPDATQPIAEARLEALLDTHAKPSSTPLMLIHAHNPEGLTGRFEHTWQGQTLERWALPAWQPHQGGYLQLTDQGQCVWQPLGVKISATYHT